MKAYFEYHLPLEAQSELWRKQAGIQLMAWMGLLNGLLWEYPLLANDGYG
jgi:hypothetical protein